MTEPPARPGEIIDLRPCGGEFKLPQQQLLLRTGDVEIVQFIVPAGEEVPTHEAQGEIVLQCLAGQIEVTAIGETRELKAGQLLYFALNEPFSMRGVQDASLLATIILPRQGPAVELVGI